MSLIADIRKITTETVDKIQAQQKKIQAHEKERDDWSDTRFAEVQANLQADMATIHREALKAVTQRVEQYKESAYAADLLDGSKLTADANLLNGSFELSGADLNAMLERSAGNRTMERLVHRYASERGVALAHRFYSAEEKAEAADELVAYARSVFQRPEYFDLMSSDEYFEQALSEAIRGE